MSEQPKSEPKAGRDNLEEKSLTGSAHVEAVTMQGTSQTAEQLAQQPDD